MEGASRDLLHIKNTNQGDVFQREIYEYEEEEEEEEEEEDLELELSLGLSMNGRFGVDPRSSSISYLGDKYNAGSIHHARVVALEPEAPLVRTSSLPAHGLMSLGAVKSVEARKRRMKKLKNVRVLVKDHKDCLDNSGLHEGANVNFSANSNIGNLNLLCSQGSIGSNMSGGSSGIYDIQQIEGAKQITKSKSTSSIQSFQKPNEQEATNQNASGPNASLKNAMFDMPYVSTKGDGLNLNRINGLLYRYKKADEVRIVCVCHGFFLSPAEFVKHGGGGDVENPLKHIVINPFPLL